VPDNTTTNLYEERAMGGSSLAGKAAIVTGASSGIGAAIAVQLAEQGADVAVVGRNRDRLAATVQSVESRGRRGVPIEADVTEEGAPERIISEATQAFGGIDILVNAAGVFELAPFEESLDALDRQWATNVRAPFALTRAAIRHLRERKGTVLFMSSVAGHIGFPTASGYCTTKGAIENLVKCLAVEEAPNGVRVNTIAPGNVRTSMNEHLLADDAYEQAMLAATPAGRIGVVEDIAPAAAFLVSPAADYITGASLVIDGGWTAQ
jgi:NAD(P)-dependent dehydrogenase (short-subunit alcohol dehydrogenase family)